MNKERRRKIAVCIENLETINDELIAIKEDEEFAFDNMPENLQSSMRGEEMQEAIEYIESALEHLEETLDELREV